MQCAPSVPVNDALVAFFKFPIKQEELNASSHGAAGLRLHANALERFKCHAPSHKRLQVVLPLRNQARRRMVKYAL